MCVCVGLRMCVNVCVMCLYGDCGVFVCVSGSVCTADVCVCVGVIMFVCVFVWWLCCVCM